LSPYLVFERTEELISRYSGCVFDAFARSGFEPILHQTTPAARFSCSVLVIRVIKSEAMKCHAPMERDVKRRLGSLGLDTSIILKWILEK